MVNIIDWQVQNDAQNIRDGAIELQSALHERRYSQIFVDEESARKWINNGKTYWRKKILEKFEIFLGKPIEGTVIEIGAGTGWCSAILSRKQAITDIYALDYDPYCVSQLMPQVHTVLQADKSKVHYVHGSFNCIPLKDHFDLVVSIGALHHSENLLKTLRECFRSLKPGGYLIASEPLEPNSMTQAIEHVKAESVDPSSTVKYGKQTRHKENSDHYYRLCQYEAAAYAAGFDVFPFVFDEGSGIAATDEIFRLKKCYEGFQLNVFKPYFARENYDRLMLVLSKPVDRIVLDKDLDEYEKQFRLKPRANPLKKAIERTLKVFNS